MASTGVHGRWAWSAVAWLAAGVSMAEMKASGRDDAKWRGYLRVRKLSKVSCEDGVMQRTVTGRKVMGESRACLSPALIFSAV